MKGFKSRDYLLKPGHRAKLTSSNSRADLLYEGKEESVELLRDLQEEIADRQELLFADQRFGVLVILQGMDASGKDGAIKHIMSGLNPQGVTVVSFRGPSEEERAHDFLWRAHVKLPPRGRLGIFNRSYYEEVVTVRVHPEFLEGQRIEADGSWKSKFWKQRFTAIRHHEASLTHEGYRVIKFYLHISRQEQKARILDRLKEPEKNWKFDPADLIAREKWDRYREAYEDALSETSTEESPWYVIPADDKPNARLMISAILLEHLKDLPLSFPKVSREKREELAKVARKLERAK